MSTPLLSKNLNKGSFIFSTISFFSINESFQLFCFFEELRRNFVGIHPLLRQVPPNADLLISIKTVFKPFSIADFEHAIPAAPAPIIATSYILFLYTKKYYKLSNSRGLLTFLKATSLVIIPFL